MQYESCLPPGAEPGRIDNRGFVVADEGVQPCPVCRQPTPRCHTVPYAFFRHLDFETIQTGGRLIACPGCGQISRLMDSRQAVQVRAIYSSQDYAHSHQTNQTVIDRRDNRQVNRCAMQARLICADLAASRPSVLDIGCFDGLLLREIRRCLTGPAVLHGYDVNPWLAGLFPGEPGYRFWHGSLAEIEGSYDLITLSYSLICIEDIGSLFAHIQRLLRPEGRLFIQVPDITRNVCGLLLGDIYQFYTPASLAALLYRHGFASRTVAADWAPRDLCCLAQRCDGSAPVEPACPDLAGLLARLQTLAGAFRDYRDCPSLWVLGTTANAAFCDSVLGGRLAGFVDENPHRLDQPFRGKPVRHPGRMGDDDTVLVPYEATAAALAARLQTSYRGTYLGF